jgi:hypothetical protein
VLSLDVFMGPCQRCGRCFPATLHERLPVTGFRHDDGITRPGALRPIGSFAPAREPESVPAVAAVGSEGVLV